MHTSLTKTLTGLLCLTLVIVSVALAQNLKQVEVSGARLAYVEQGTGDPVVLVHGAVADYRIWAAQMASFAPRYRVIAYSMRYHYPNAPADATADYTAMRHAADLAELIKVLKVAPAHIVAHSYGGTVAAYLAKDHPELIRSLVLAEPGTLALIAQRPEAKALGEERGAAMGRVQDAVKAGNNEDGVKNFLDYWLAPRGFAGLSASDRAAVLDNAGTLPAMFRAAPPTKPFSCEDAKNVKIPTLLVGGDATLRTFTLVLDELSKCLPNAEQATLAGTAHGVQFENATAFNYVVLRFLAKY